MYNAHPLHHVLPRCALLFAAEEQLTTAKVQPQCVLTVLQILTQEAVNPAVRQAAAVFFKNLVKAHWAPEDETAYTVPAETKTQVKNGLLTLFLSVPAKLQAQLSEAMSLIATHDFPQQWPNLLGELVSQLSAAAGAQPRDYAKISGLLAIAHSITGRYRHEFKSDTLYAEIKTVLEAMQTPLLELSKLAAADLPAATQAGEGPTRTLLGALTLICKLFYDLTAQDLPEYFEDHLAEWMGTFTAVLKYSNPSLAADDDDSEPSPISLLQVRGGGHMTRPAQAQPPSRRRQGGHAHAQARTRAHAHMLMDTRTPTHPHTRTARRVMGVPLSGAPSAPHVKRRATADPSHGQLYTAPLHTHCGAS